MTVYTVSRYFARHYIGQVPKQLGVIGLLITLSDSNSILNHASINTALDDVL